MSSPLLRIEVRHPSGELFTCVDDPDECGLWLHRTLQRMVINEHISAMQIRITAWPM